jgi:hypothetical protein
MPAATSLAIASIGVSAAGAGASFVQAGKQRQLQQKAEAEAARTLEEARKKLDVNFYEQLGINKEAYELEREALLVQGAQAIDAAVESERGAAATAGRVQLAQQEGQAGVRTAMAQEVMGLNKLVAGEESRLRDAKVNLDLAEAQGAQLAARDAQQAAAASFGQGVAGVQSVAQQGLQMVPLYQKTQGAKITSQIADTAMGSQYGLSQVDLQRSIAGMGSVNNVDLSKVASMTPLQYQDFMNNLDLNTLKAIQQQIPTSLQSFNPYGFNAPGVGGQ